MNSSYLTSFIDSHAKTQNSLKPLADLQMKLTDSLNSVRRLTLCGLADASPKSHSLKPFSWPTQDMIRQANCVTMLESYKLKKISVKTDKGKLVAL